MVERGTPDIGKKDYERESAARRFNCFWQSSAFSTTAVSTANSSVQEPVAVPKRECLAGAITG